MAIYANHSSKPNARLERRPVGADQKDAAENAASDASDLLLATADEDGDDDWWQRRQWQ